MTPPAARPEVSWDRTGPRLPGSPDQPIRVVILRFLLNWPTTGGGNHHTAELPKFLAVAGYEVKHFFARYQGWGIGRVTDELISPSEAIPFDKSSWNVPDIPARFRQAVDSFAPDFVMITGAWNMKPLLAEAVRGYPYFLLYQAQENLEPAPAGDWGRIKSNSVRATRLPRPRFAVAEWPSAGVIPVHSIVPNACWLGWGRRIIMRGCANR